MPSEVIENWDPVEWKEFLPGVYHLRSDPTQIAFRCESKEETKSNVVPHLNK